MTTLYIDRRHLSLDIQGDALVFYEDNQRIQTVPLKVLERICIHGNLTLNARVLGKLGEENIGIVVLSGRQQRPTLLMPNYKLDGKRRQRQYAQSQNLQFIQLFSQNIVQEKINKQIQLLSHISAHPNTISFLNQIVQQIPFADTIQALRGLEGVAAAHYFEAWQAHLSPEWQFHSRNRRPPRDPINALLSLGYTLLHFELVKHIYLCGLDPFIGFYHVAEHGRESLACDLLETLRPEYDQWLWAHIQQNTFSPSDFSTNAQGCTLNKEARLRFYQHYEILAKTWRPKFHQQCRQLLAQFSPHDPDCALGELKIIENPTEEEMEE